MKNTLVFSFPPALCAFSSSWARPKKAAPSEYQCRYSLRVRLFHRWQPVLWNPCAFGDRDLSPESRYSCQHAHSRVLQKRSPFSFDGTQDAPLPRRRCFFFWPSVVSVVFFSPEYSWRMHAHSVRWYAIIIGRLLPSPPPECHCVHTSFCTQNTLWDLNGRSGLFPSRLRTFAPEVCPVTLSSSAFGVFLAFVKL